MAEVEVYPAIYAMPDEEHENLHIEIELPGVEKENIRLRMHEDIRYVGSYAVCCPVDYEQARAEFRNGLLIIDVPYKKPQVRGREIPVA
ncbi:putative small heat shock protein [hydrocarbon metagenome]|uniref:Putative small heat shock protein n=1 Tax=hydrocarbon metagenome TaxID=938273 RepID=A0A0W8FIH0_9ZZZZ